MYIFKFKRHPTLCVPPGLPLSWPLLLSTVAKVILQTVLCFFCSPHRIELITTATTPLPPAGPASSWPTTVYCLCLENLLPLTVLSVSSHFLHRSQRTVSHRSHSILFFLCFFKSLSLHWAPANTELTLTLWGCDPKEVNTRQSTEGCQQFVEGIITTHIVQASDAGMNLNFKHNVDVRLQSCEHKIKWIRFLSRRRKVRRRTRSRRQKTFMYKWTTSSWFALTSNNTFVEFWTRSGKKEKETVQYTCTDKEVIWNWMYCYSTVTGLLKFIQFSKIGQ